MVESYLENNKTWNILQAAEKGKYGVPCVNVYNMEGVFATIRAAEKKNSPAMIEVFPWSIEQFGDVFITFAADACKKAKVPVALHLDHAMNEDTLAKAFDMPFDSIMVDMSRHSEEVNVIKTKGFVELAKKKGICVEAELGRIDGGEDGVMESDDIEALMTKPEDAISFMKETGVNLIAPSFGNVHGDYGPRGPYTLDFEVLKGVRKALGPGVPIVLHGTNDFTEEIMKKCVECGVSKVNVNKVVAHKYYDYTGQAWSNTELTKLIENGITEFQEGIETMMDWLGATGKGGL